MENLKSILALLLFISFIYVDYERLTNEGMIIWIILFIITINLP